MYKEGENMMMRKVFDLHMLFLRINQSEQTLKHCFGLIRMFINKVITITLFVLFFINALNIIVISATLVLIYMFSCLVSTGAIQRQSVVLRPSVL